MKFAGICLQIVEFESVGRVVVDELVSFRPYPYIRLTTWTAAHTEPGCKNCRWREN